MLHSACKCWHPSKGISKTLVLHPIYLGGKQLAFCVIGVWPLIGISFMYWRSLWRLGDTTECISWAFINFPHFQRPKTNQPKIEEEKTTKERYWLFQHLILTHQPPTNIQRKNQIGLIFTLYHTLTYPASLFPQKSHF